MDVSAQKTSEYLNNFRNFNEGYLTRNWIKAQKNLILGVAMQLLHIRMEVTRRNCGYIIKSKQELMSNISVCFILTGSMRTLPHKNESISNILLVKFPISRGFRFIVFFFF